MGILVQHLLHPAVAGAGHRVHRMRARRPRRLQAIRPSHRNELWYRHELTSIVDKAHAAVVHKLLPGLKPRFPGLMADAAADTVEAMIAELRRMAFGSLGHQAEVLAKLAAVKNLGAVDERLTKAIYDSVSVDIAPYLAHNPRIAQVFGDKVLANVDLIQTIPERYFNRVAEVIADNWQAGQRWESLVDDVMDVGGVARERAEVIARDQTAKMNASFNQVRQTDVGIDEYDWETSDDERVRGAPGGKYPDAESDHYALDGQTFSWHEPGPCAGTIGGEPCHPGEDIMCRCNARPHIDIDALDEQVANLEAS